MARSPGDEAPGEETAGVARRFAEDWILPSAGRWELEKSVPREVFLAAAEAGLCGLLVPERDGGAGSGPLVMIRVMETLAAADMAFAFSLVVHDNLAGAVARRGSPAQRERYLPDLLSARRIGAFLLTEPGAGSDAAAITTRARADGDGWIIDGEKAWCTNAGRAGLLSVYARIEGAGPGWRGIACFLVEADAEGVTPTGPYDLMGCHAMATGGFRFDGCRLPGEALFIPAGEAFPAAMEGIDIARVNVAAMCAGMMQAGLDCALEYTSGRRAFGRPVAEFQGLAWQLADVATDAHAARLMAYEAARLFERDGQATVAAAHAKKFATRAAVRGLAACMQAMGARGFSHDYPLARHLAGAKMAEFLDGTTEIQNVVISRALFAPWRRD